MVILPTNLRDFLKAKPTFKISQKLHVIYEAESK